MKLVHLCCKPAVLYFFVLLLHDSKALFARPRLISDYPGNETDRAALLAIKRKLVDLPNGVLSTWNNSVEHCKWEGVTCGRKHNRVTVLDLHARGLSGTISPFIGNLTFLTTVSFYNNSLYGLIPSTVGNLYRLRGLFSQNNKLTGEIPTNLSSCINLRVLSVGSNKLEGKLPTGLSAMSKLERLSIETNNFTGPLFDIIQNLTSLQYISTKFNQFTGAIPDSIVRMHDLSILRLGFNKLSGTLPVSLFNISSLQMLDVSGNQFHGELPSHIGFDVNNLLWLSFGNNQFSGSIPSIANFTNLEAIIFATNSFTGRIPSDFSLFRKLRVLVLAENNLEGDIDFIRTLVNCTKLSLLELAENDFTGTLPESVVNLSTTLTYLTIGVSSIGGKFPADITNLINLVDLEMFGMNLMGSLPYDLGKLDKLVYLDFSSNRLTGKIPNSLGNLSYLGTLYLEDNNLEDRVPQNIGNCQSLLYMYLESNRLTGTLDYRLFSGSAKFVELDLSYNDLDGPLPLEISKQTTLVKLILSRNKFSGTLPDGLSELTELQYLLLDGNSFHGDISPSYASLTSLQEINFSRNNFAGPIPAFFSRISSIHYLDLSYNDFQGRVPTNSVFANASAVVVVGNRRLCGGIPELRLPRCVDNKNGKGKKITLSSSLKVIIAVISALVVVLAFLTGIYLTCIRKKKMSLTSESVMGKAFMKVSYDMLFKATNGFSSENLLGSGSFGSVFKGILDGKTVAVKVFNSQHHAASKSFVTECKALRNIRHRNLVGIITACSSIDYQRSDFKALVFEFMSNGSLDVWLHRVAGNISLSKRVDIAIDVGHALNYLHHDCETPIVHCDLKPSNVLLDHDMVAHVGDFGLSRFPTQARHPNQSSTIGIKGTIGYTAPEYGVGNEASTDGDIYSYGILLLELITGKSPTDKMFTEGYDLHTYAEVALPNYALQIVDPALEDNSLTTETEDRREIQDAFQRRIECIVTVISVGVSCSNPLPQNRMRIPDAISRLQIARDNLLNNRNRRTA